MKHITVATVKTKADKSEFPTWYPHQHANTKYLNLCKNLKKNGLERTIFCHKSIHTRLKLSNSPVETYKPQIKNK